MPFIQTPNLGIYYEQGNNNHPAVLFISGSGADLRVKPNQFDAPIAAQFDLLCYDQRGLGRTDKPTGDYTMQQYGDDAAALLDALQIDKMAVVGVSFGGMVAQNFVLQHPQRVSSLVLCCTSAGGLGGASYPLHELQNLAPRERAEAHLKIADLRHTDQWISENPQAWEKRVHISMAMQKRGTDELTKIGAEKQLQARRGHDTFAQLSKIDVPVLLAGGEFDGIAPKANMQAMHEQIPGSELIFYQGGHMFLIQDKKAYTDICGWLLRQ